MLDNAFFKGVDWVVAYLSDEWGFVESRQALDESCCHYFAHVKGAEAAVEKALAVFANDKEHLDSAYGDGHFDRCVATIKTVPETGLPVIVRLEYGHLVVMS